MNTSHAVRDTYGEKKSDNEEPTCDSTLNFQSASPADYQHEVINTVRTTEKGIFRYAAFYAHTIRFFTDFRAKIITFGRCDSVVTYQPLC